MSQEEEAYKRQLINRYLAGEATEKELMAFFGLLSEEQFDRLIAEHMEGEIDEILRKERSLPVRKTIRWPRIAVAASVILSLSAGGYFMLHKSQPVQQIAQNNTNDIAPGGNKATLTLSDGRKIVLSDARNGTIASQGQTLVNKTADGKLVYAVNSPSGTGSGEPAAVYNMLTTKRGEQYEVTLPDGSKVFLNAASSLRYPVAFAGHERRVELTGEGYFVVVHNAMQPFKVVAGSQIIEDIGTQFDVNAYADEPAERTTLVEGAVRVNALVLKPGEQTDGNTIRKVDPQTVTSWKNGEFRADNETLEEILKQAARWYDVYVHYESEPLKGERFGVIGNRYANISGLLRDLELTRKVKFRIENRTIYVSNPN